MTNTATVEIHLSEPGNKNSMRVVFTEFKGWVAVDGASGMALQYLISRFGTRVKKNVFETTDPEIIDLGKKLVTANHQEKHKVVFKAARKIVDREPSTDQPNAVLDFGLIRATRVTLKAGSSDIGKITLTRSQGLVNLLTFIGKASTLCGVTTDDMFELKIDQGAMAKILTASKSPLGGICRAFDPDNPGGYDEMVKSIERAKERKRVIEAKFRALVSGSQLTRRTPLGNVAIKLVKSRARSWFTPAYDMTMILQGNTITITKVIKKLNKDDAIKIAFRDRPLAIMEGSYIMKTPNSVISASFNEDGDVEWSDILTAVAQKLPILSVIALNPPNNEER
ncbi:MAG: hypothetical protein JRM72_01250 [Nitrososphaerota archaeon]|nr:hypothetical protein [Nitrososphaerota archaeon]